VLQRDSCRVGSTRARGTASASTLVARVRPQTEQGRQSGELRLAAYVVANVTVKDPVRYEDYRRLVTPTIELFGGRFIARGGKIEVLEGDWHPGRLVILEFPSVEQARAWWHSAAYAEARAIRQATSEGTLLILEGV
jgi:uncharacterized protein (DUF1330 family)